MGSKTHMKQRWCRPDAGIRSIVAPAHCGVFELRNLSRLPSWQNQSRTTGHLHQAMFRITPHDSPMRRECNSKGEGRIYSTRQRLSRNARLSSSSTSNLQDHLLSAPSEPSCKRTHKRSRHRFQVYQYANHVNGALVKDSREVGRCGASEFTWTPLKA